MAIGDAASGPDTFTIGSKTYNKVAGSDPPVYQIASAAEIQSKFWEDVTIPNDDPTQIWPVSRSLHELIRIKGRDEGMHNWEQEGGQLELIKSAAAGYFDDNVTPWDSDGISLDYYYDTNNWYGRGANKRYLRIHNNLATGYHILYDQSPNTGGLFLAHSTNGSFWEISKLGIASSLSDISDSEMSWLTSLINSSLPSVPSGETYTAASNLACPITRNGTTFYLPTSGGNIGGINGAWTVDFRSMESVAPGIKNAIAVSCRTYLNETYLHYRRLGTSTWNIAGAVGNNNNAWRYFVIPIDGRPSYNTNTSSQEGAVTGGVVEFSASQAPGDDKTYDMSSLNLLGYWY